MADRYTAESTSSDRPQTKIPSSAADPALRPFLALLETDIEQSPLRLEPMESDFMVVAIAITGSWQNLVDFDPSSFDFTEDDATELSDLFAEIKAEEAGV